MKEIKCPKCGSKTHELHDGVLFCNDLMCDWNSKNPTYQQRLERVLSKFEKIDDMYSMYWFDNYRGISHSTEDGFNFWDENLEGYYCENLSLDTVESLIKDLERNE